MAAPTAKASLIREGEPTLSRAITSAVRERSPGHGAGDRRVEVGAGGGSIAWIDEHRRAQGRPAERGRRSRPICYRGGEPSRRSPTRISCWGGSDPDDFLGGQMVLDAKAAAQGIVEKIAGPRGK